MKILFLSLMFILFSTSAFAAGPYLACDSTTEVTNYYYRIAGLPSVVLPDPKVIPITGTISNCNPANCDLLLDLAFLPSKIKFPAKIARCISSEWEIDGIEQGTNEMCSVDVDFTLTRKGAPGSSGGIRLAW